MTNEHTSLEKYTFHTLFAKVLIFLVCERWVRNGDKLPNIDPKFLWPLQHYFLILAGLLNRGHWGPKPSVWSGSHSGILSPTRTELSQAVSGTWLYMLPVGVASALNSTTSTGHGDIPTSSTGCTCFFRLFTLFPYTSQIDQADINLKTIVKLIHTNKR